MRSIISEHGENINYSFTLGIALDSANTLSYSISNLLMARKPQVFEAISSCRKAHGTKKMGKGKDVRPPDLLACSMFYGYHPWSRLSAPR